MTAPMQPPPADLIVVERARVQVAMTQVRAGAPGEEGPVTEEIALVLELGGRLNNSTQPRTAELILDTATAAKLTGALLEGLDVMRARTNARPD